VKNIYSLKKPNFVLLKTTIFLSLGLHKGLQATEEVFSLQKRTSSTSKHEMPYFFSIFVVIFALLDSNPKHFFLDSFTRKTGGSNDSQKYSEKHVQNAEFLPLWDGEVDKNIHFDRPRVNQRRHSQLLAKNFAQTLHPACKKSWRTDFNKEFGIVHFEHHCTDFFENIANFRNLVVSLRRLQSKLPNPTDNGRTDHFNEFKRGNIVHLR
jgi:hypothetical protein